MSRRPLTNLFLIGLAVLLATLLAGPRIVRGYWTRKSSNPVRRGVARARELGCFACHGSLGSAGIKDPGGEGLEVPAWGGGMYMMYVHNDHDIQTYILAGSVPKVESAGAASGAPPPRAAVAMPSFRRVLSGSDLDDLTAAYKVLAQMVAPPAGSPAERGLQLARTWGCQNCHGPGGSGGAPNPGSLTGFIPGWYGADFKDLVQGREEFDSWVRQGHIARLENNPLAAYFLARQRISMPAYQRFTPSEVDDLWAYARWLEEAGGGTQTKQEPTP